MEPPCATPIIVGAESTDEPRGDILLPVPRASALACVAPRRVPARRSTSRLRGAAQVARSKAGARAEKSGAGRPTRRWRGSGAAIAISSTATTPRARRSSRRSTPRACRTATTRSTSSRSPSCSTAIRPRRSITFSALTHLAGTVPGAGPLPRSPTPLRGGQLRRGAPRVRAGAAVGERLDLSRRWRASASARRSSQEGPGRAALAAYRKLYVDAPLHPLADARARAAGALEAPADHAPRSGSRAPSA